MLGTQNDFFNLVRFSNCDRPQTWGQKILDLAVLLLQCVVCHDLTKTAHHTQTDFQPVSRLLTQEISQNLSRPNNEQSFLRKLRSFNVCIRMLCFISLLCLVLFTKAGSVLGDTQDYYIKITIEKSFATTTKKLSILLTLYCSIKLCSL